MKDSSGIWTIENALQYIFKPAENLYTLIWTNNCNCVVNLDLGYRCPPQQWTKHDSIPIIYFQNVVVCFDLFSNKIWLSFSGSSESFCIQTLLRTWMQLQSFLLNTHSMMLSMHVPQRWSVTCSIYTQHILAILSDDLLCSILQSCPGNHL